MVILGTEYAGEMKKVQLEVHLLGWKLGWNLERDRMGYAYVLSKGREQSLK